MRPFPRGLTSWRCAWYRAYVRCSLRRTSMARICAKRTSQKCKCGVWIFQILLIILPFLGRNPMEFSLVAFSWSQCFSLYLCPLHSTRTLPRTRLRGVNQRPFHTIRWLMISNNWLVLTIFFLFCAIVRGTDCCFIIDMLHDILGLRRWCARSAMAAQATTTHHSHAAPANGLLCQLQFNDSHDAQLCTSFLWHLRQHW